MSEQATKIDRLEFKSPINLERSCGLQPIAKRAKSVMELYFYKDNTGFIEWEVPAYDLHVEIGLVFEITPAGKRILTDYDGVMTLPSQAMDLLEKNGVNCTEMRGSLS